MYPANCEQTPSIMRFLYINLQIFFFLLIIAALCAPFEQYSYYMRTAKFENRNYYSVISTFVMPFSSKSSQGEIIETLLSAIFLTAPL